MDWGIAVILFFLNICDDALGVFFTRRMVAGKAIEAAVLGGILTFLISISVIKYVENRWYLIPIVSGSMIGCYVAIKLDKYLKRRTNERKKLSKTAKRPKKTDRGILCGEKEKDGSCQSTTSCQEQDSKT